MCHSPGRVCAPASARAQALLDGTRNPRRRCASLKLSADAFHRTSCRRTTPRCSSRARTASTCPACECLDFDGPLVDSCIPDAACCCARVQARVGAAQPQLPVLQRAHGAPRAGARLKTRRGRVWFARDCAKSVRPPRKCMRVKVCVVYRKCMRVAVSTCLYRAPSAPRCQSLRAGRTGGRTAAGGIRGNRRPRRRCP